MKCENKNKKRFYDRLKPSMKKEEKQTTKKLKDGKKEKKMKIMKKNERV